MSIFQHQSYREYIKKKVADGASERGYQSRLAAEAGCHRSYFSQVLSGTCDLTLDQAARLADYWGLNEKETEYFVLLVNHEKAGSAQLQKIVKRRMNELKQSSVPDFVLNKSAHVMPVELEVKYYSQWYYGVVNLMIATTKYQTPVAVSQRLNLPLRVVEEAISTLETMGFIRRERNRWRLVHREVFLNESSIMQKLMHTNWRQRAIQGIQNHDPTYFCVSQLFSISEKDIPELEKLVAECYQKMHALVEKSGEEEVVVFNCDLFLAK